MIKLNSIILLLCVLIGESSCSHSTKKSLPFRHFGIYSGDFELELDTFHGKSKGVISSSASQVYEGDNSFDCKLILIQDTVTDTEVVYQIFNSSKNSTKPVGRANIKSVDDTTIRITFPNDYMDVGACSATIDFSDSSILSFVSRKSTAK